MKNILAAILAGFGVMFIMITTPKGTEPLSPDGDYTYPEYCIGHESDFVVDKSANSYINHGNVSDAITYVGTNGDFSCGEISLSPYIFQCYSLNSSLIPFCYSFLSLSNPTTSTPFCCLLFAQPLPTFPISYHHWECVL